MKTLNSNTVELHYHFTDHEHRIDAFVQNRCEHELLVLMKELTKYFEFEFSIETELTQSGGIRKFFKIKPNDLSKKDKSYNLQADTIHYYEYTIKTEGILTMDEFLQLCKEVGIK